MPRSWRRLRVLPALIVVAAACTTGGDSDTTPSPPDTGSPEELAGLPGRLLITGLGPELVVADPDGARAEELTAPSPDPTDILQPTWSPDGTRVVWSETGGEGRDHDATVVVATVDSGERREVGVPEPPFFYQWRPDGEQIAYLAAAPRGNQNLALGMVDVSGETMEAGAVDGGSPYYLDWSPQGGTLVFHVADERIGLLSPGKDPETFLAVATGFQAPEWSPDGDRLAWVTGGENGGVVTVAARSGRAQAAPGQRLVISDIRGEVERVVTEFVGSVAFAFDSEGERLAYSLQEPDGEGTALGDLWVHDVSTGENERVAREGVVAFSWSPAGSLLRLVLEEPGEARAGLRLRPEVWAGGRSTAFPAFTPTIVFLTEYLPFWDQYQRALSVWAPDGSAIAYAAQTAAGEQILVQPVEDGGDPVPVADGSFVSWSPTAGE